MSLLGFTCIVYISIRCSFSSRFVLLLHLFVHFFPRFFITLPLEWILRYYHFQTDDRYSTLNVYYLLSNYEIELHEIAKRNNTSDTICVYYAYTSCKLAEYGYDPAAVLQITLKLLKKYPTSVDVVLALFAQMLTRCPVEFLNTFLSSCKLTSIS